MAMQWMTPREFSSPWVSKSADGYYAIAQPVMGEYGAYHIEALWARPTEIGRAGSIMLAQELCDTHRSPTKSHQPTPQGS